MLKKPVDFEIREGKEEEFNSIIQYIKQKYRLAKIRNKNLHIEIRIAEVEKE